MVKQTLHYISGKQLVFYAVEPNGGKYAEHPYEVK
jgi:hypothetical protein